MQVFKTYFLILKKYKGTVILFFAVFMTLALIMAKQNSVEKQKSFSEEELEIGLIDEDGKTFGLAMQEYFGENIHWKKIEDDRPEITNELYWRSLDYVLVIPEGFEESLIAGSPMALSCMQVPGYFDAAYFEADLDQYLQKMTAMLSAGYSMQETEEELDKLKEEKTDVEMASFVNENQHDASTNFFLYVPYLFLSVGVVGIGLVLLRLNEKEVKDRTECSSTSLRERNLGITMAIMVFGIMMYLAVLVIDMVLSGGSILTDSRLPWFALNLFAMLLFGLSLGFLTGTVAKNGDAVNGIVNVAGLTLCFLGGVFVPQEFFGEGVAKVAKFLPTYWYVRNNEEIGQMTQVTARFTKEILTQAGVIFVYALVVFAVTLVIISAKRKRTA